MKDPQPLDNYQIQKMYVHESVEDICPADHPMFVGFESRMVHINSRIHVVSGAACVVCAVCAGLGQSESVRECGGVFCSG